MSAPGARDGLAAGVWERYAPAYDGWMRVYDRFMLGDGREWVASRAEGLVLEVAVGTGLNLPLFRPGISIVGVDQSIGMLAIARQRAAAREPDAVLVRADAQALPFAAGVFDTVVCTLGLCCVPDHRGAIRQMRHVLRSGGRLLLLDHVLSTNTVAALLQRALDGVAWRRCGDRQTRRSLPLLAEAGFRVDEAQRTRAGTIERLAAVKVS